jgi:hypothetical protein
MPDDGNGTDDGESPAAEDEFSYAEGTYEEVVYDDSEGSVFTAPKESDTVTERDFFHSPYEEIVFEDSEGEEFTSPYETVVTTERGVFHSPYQELIFEEGEGEVFYSRYAASVFDDNQDEIFSSAYREVVSGSLQPEWELGTFVQEAQQASPRPTGASRSMQSRSKTALNWYHFVTPRSTRSPDQPPRTVTPVPILRTAAERRDAIIKDSPGIIKVSEDPGVRANPYPYFYREGAEEVTKNDALIKAAAERHHIEPDLIRAAMWQETTHGWTDVIKPEFLRMSLRPMNIHLDFWKGFGITRNDMRDPAKNIEIGARILAGLSKRIENPTVRKIISLYVSISQDKVTVPGANGNYFYRTKPWLETKGK